MTTSNQKFWLIHAVDDDPVVCRDFDSAVDLAIATREVIENNVSRHVYLFSFYGCRLSISHSCHSPSERYLIVPHHDPKHYPLFGRSGEMAEVEDSNGLISTGTDFVGPDADYSKVTAEAQNDGDEPEESDSDDLLSEPEEPLKEA